MSTKMNINKVKLAKVKDGDGLSLSYTKVDADKSPATGDEDHKGLIHPDLRVAMQGLRIHLAILSGFVKESDVKSIAEVDEALVEKFKVNGLSIGGTEDNPGITIMGGHTTPRGKSQGLNTPFELFDVSPESRYSFMDDLIARKNVVLTEAQLYVTGEKRGTPEVKEKEPKVDPNQTKLDLGGIPKADPEAMGRVKDMPTGGKKGNKKEAEA